MTAESSETNSAEQFAAPSSTAFTVLCSLCDFLIAIFWGKLWQLTDWGIVEKRIKAGVYTKWATAVDTASEEQDICSCSEQPHLKVWQKPAGIEEAGR